MRLDIHRLYAPILRHFRKRRMGQFVDRFKPTVETRLLDVGGTAPSWRLADLDGRPLLLNIGVPPDRDPGFDYMVGDGCALSFKDATFDIGFSNSVIEHLGTYENQVRFASEIRRVSDGLWVQTPARSFFFEPHLLAPFVHWFPKSVQRRLIRNATLRGWLMRPSMADVDSILAELRLLSFAEMRELFPDCTIVRERFFGFTKSYVAVRDRSGGLAAEPSAVR